MFKSRPEKQMSSLFEINQNILTFSNHLTLREVDQINAPLTKSLKKYDENSLIIELANLERLDSAGVVFLDNLQESLDARNIQVEIRPGNDKIRSILQTFAIPEIKEPLPERTGFFEKIGRSTFQFKEKTIQEYFYQMSDLAYWTFIGLFSRKHQRKGEIVNQAVTIGVNALPIVGLISFLIGLVLALQSAAQLRQFGANIFIVDLVVIAMTAEMGPLLTAIMIAGRSGSAIASELASMKVAEEIDALQTMALNPLRYLVAPKMQASILTLPFLTLLADILGILGGMVVAYFYLDISPVAFYHRMSDSLMLKDIITGIIKSLVFAGLIVQTSTFFGLHVSGGAVGVGKYTTKAVVTSIFLVILADSILGLIFY